MLNRTAIVLRYQEPFVRWINDTDESLWPTDRSLALFHEWIHVEYHTTVVDVVDGPLVDDDL